MSFCSKVVKSELFKNIDSVLHHSGINENIEVLKGDKFIIGKTVYGTDKE